ncbi:MAG: hypothetical protein QOE09_2807 [Ilumatobacteraceae bacterium]|jgi:hypothetical protein
MTGSTMTALTLESAKNIGIAVAVGLIALMLVMAVVVKNIVAKLLTIVIVGGMALGVWTQRSSLQDCASKVRSRTGVNATTDVTCTFLGSDIRVSSLSAP